MIKPPAHIWKTAILVMGVLILAAGIAINNQGYRTVILVYVILALVLFAYMFFFRPEKLIGPTGSIKEHLFWGVGFAAVFYFINRVFPAFTLANPLNAFTDLSTITKFFTLVIAAPILEEAVFRGGVQSYLDHTVAAGRISFLQATIFQSVLFSLFHALAYGLAFERTGLFIGAFFFGIAATLLAVWRKSTIPGTIGHSLINFSLFAKSVVTV